MWKELFCLVKWELSGTVSKMEKWAKNWQKPIKLKYTAFSFRIGAHLLTISSWQHYVAKLVFYYKN